MVSSWPQTQKVSSVDNAHLIWNEWFIISTIIIEKTIQLSIDPLAVPVETEILEDDAHPFRRVNIREHFLNLFEHCSSICAPINFVNLKSFLFFHVKFEASLKLFHIELSYLL